MVVFRQSRPPEDLRRWPEGPIDPLVRVVLCKEVNGSRMTGICNYNCHPSAAGGDGALYATGAGIGYVVPPECYSQGGFRDETGD
jgi:hypothetical protein